MFLDKFKLTMEVIIALGTFITSTVVIMFNHRAQAEAVAAEATLQDIKTQQATQELILRAQEQSLKQQAQALEQVRHLNEYNLNVYKEVVGALKAKDARLERVAMALVDAMPSDDPLRKSLTLAMVVGATSQETQEQAIYLSEQLEASTSPSGGGPANWDVDVIYCEGLKGGAEQAQLLATSLQSTPLGESGSVGRIRVRKLPASLNKRSGYQVTGLQIRRESSEEQAAQSLKSVAVKALGVGQEQIRVFPISTSTPRYLSFFICPGSSAASMMIGSEVR